MNMGVTQRNSLGYFMGGCIPWNKGIPCSEETKKKMSQTKIGNCGGEKHPFWNKHHSEETKVKISLAKRGKPTRRMGEHHSGETKQKLIKAWKRRKERGDTPWNKGLTAENDERVNQCGLKQRGKIVSKETRLKQSIAHKGEKAWNWAGGISRERDLIMVTKEYRDWRIVIFERDDYICQKCLKRGGKLHAHHILPYSIYPDEIFELDNGATLCEGCHRHVHKRGNNGIENFCRI